MNYYKILNEKEIHNNMKYKTGMNTDVLPFFPSGDCTPGGIYFAREDILGFLDYGPWIRLVTLPEGEEIYTNPGETKKYKARRVILGKRRKITLAVIKKLVNEGVNIHANDDCALRLAADGGHLATVKYLVEQGADIHAYDDGALRHAAGKGHLATVKYLVKCGADVHAINNYSLRWAAEGGHTDVVKYLKRCN